MTRLSRIAIVQELGSRRPRCLAAHAVRGQGEPELVVVERYSASFGADVLAVIEQDARTLASLEHRDLAPILACAKLKGDVAVVSTWVDGEGLGELKPPLEIALRVVSDVLEGLGALHASAVCGAVTPADVFVGSDGRAHVARFWLGRVAPKLLDAGRLGYMAPEFLRGEASARADVFAVGALLWECLCSKPLFERAASVEEQLQKLTATVPRATPPSDAPWAENLVDVAVKALALDPLARYATAAEMASAIASAAGANMATRGRVAEWVGKVAGQRIMARRAKLEPKSGLSFGPLSLSPAAPPVVDIPKVDPLPKVDPPPKVDEPPPKVEPVKLEAPKVELAKAAPKVEPAKVEPPKAEPAKRVASPPKQQGSIPKLATASVPKAPGSAPNVAMSPTRKAIPLPFPKRSQSIPDDTPAQAPAHKAAPSVSDATPPKATAAKPVHAEPPSKPRLEPAAVKEPAPEAPPRPAPASADEVEVDVDVDAISMRPAPLPAPAPAPAPSPSPVAAPPPPSAPALPGILVGPPPSPTPAPSPRPEPVQAADDDTEPLEAPRRSALRSLTLTILGLCLFFVGFVGGRMSAPASTPATPSCPESTTVTSAESPRGSVPLATSSATVSDAQSPSATAASSASSAPAERFTPRGVVGAVPSARGSPASDASSPNYAPTGI